jgi:GntR family transcriptional regulator, transcriptional repressor for pyruvate dehydrogenase complex
MSKEKELTYYNTLLYYPRMNIKEFAPIESGDKIEKIVELLKHLVIEEKIPPGSELPAERELSAQLNVSRYSLREALRAAEAQGLIELSRGKRPKIKPPTSEALTNIFGIAIQRSKISLFDLIIARISLECDIVAMAAENADDDMFERLEDITLKMEKNKHNIALCAELDTAFHDILVEKSGNHVFRLMLDSVAYYLKTSRIATIRLGGVERALKGHRNIIAALKLKDGKKARYAMLTHLEMAEDDILLIEKLEAERNLQ